MKRYDKETSVIHARPGESFVLALETTGGGYQWSAEPDPNLLRQVSQEAKLAGSGVGAGSRAEFTFQAQRPGEGRLVLEYGRSWEGKPLERRTIQIVVE